MQRKGRRTQRGSISHRPTTLVLAAGCRIPMLCGCGICPGEGSCEHLPHLPAPGPQQLIPRAMTLGAGQRLSPMEPTAQIPSAAPTGTGTSTPVSTSFKG